MRVEALYVQQKSFECLQTRSILVGVRLLLVQYHCAPECGASLARASLRLFLACMDLYRGFSFFFLNFFIFLFIYLFL